MFHYFFTVGGVKKREGKNKTIFCKSCRISYDNSIFIALICVQLNSKYRVLLLDNDGGGRIVINSFKCVAGALFPSYAFISIIMDAVLYAGGTVSNL